MASGAADHAVDVDQTMIVAGVGCRKGAQPEEIKAVVLAALERAGLALSELRLIATMDAKSGERGIEAAATAMGVPLVLVAPADLETASMRGATRSERVKALVGVSSVAEAAALAAGGLAARLIAPRIMVGPATCALAQTEEAR
jgi:cobalt-precorrin 5A hydrolase